VKNKQQDEYLSAIDASGKSLLRLIDDILDLSKVEAGKLTLEYTEVDLPTVLREVAHVFSKRIADKGLDFKIEIDPRLPRVVILDETRLRQILFNLVSNAIKFTDSGYIRIYTSYHFESTNESELILLIEDTGIGIPKDQTDIIFHAFEQQREQSHTKYGGTGLGLTITKHLVELLGGEIWVTSQRGQGSIFKIIIKNIKVAKTAKATIPLSLDVNTVAFKEAKILIVDDVQLNRELLKTYLDYPKVELIEAENGEEAINLALHFLPDVILMDMKMPIVDGQEATKIIKQHDSLKNIPIIAITASVMKDYEIQLRSFCDSVLKKPITKTELVLELVRFLKYSVIPLEPIDIAASAPREQNQLCVHNPQVLAVKLSELIEILQGEVKTKWQGFKDTLTINNIEDFANYMKMLGIEYHYNPLVIWGDHLYSQATVFDIRCFTRNVGGFSKNSQPIISG
jgi:CheY-like chemotaxis protein/two-component sensor histidine kinase